MNVKIISTDNGNALIEWVDNGQYHRSIVPADSIVAGQVERPEWGLEYGEDWVTLIPALDPFALANELRRRGIYTVEDLQRQHKAALGAVMHVAGQVLGGLVGKAQGLQRRRS